MINLCVHILFHRNFLNEEDQLGYLCLCPQLSNLTLSGNPVTHTLSATPTGYRAAVRRYIPHLKCLDEVPYEDIDLESSASSALLSPSLVEGWRKMNKGEGISPLKLHSRGNHDHNMLAYHILSILLRVDGLLNTDHVAKIFA